MGIKWFCVLLWCTACSADSPVLRARPVTTPVLAHGQQRGAGLEALLNWQAAQAAGQLQGFDGAVLDLGFERVAHMPMPVPTSSIGPALSLARGLSADMPHNLQALSLAFRSPPWADNAFFLEVSNNFEAAAAAAAQAHMRGVFIDNQSYSQPAFAVPSDGDLTFSQWEALARQRGAELTAALLRGFPGLTIMVAWGYSEMFREICIAGKPLATHPYALYPAFLDGMLEAVRRAAAPAKLIDGYLPSYPARTLAHFKTLTALVAADEVGLAKSWSPDVITHWDDVGGDAQGPVLWPRAYKRQCAEQVAERLLVPLAAAFGLMVDYDVDVFPRPVGPEVSREPFRAERLRPAIAAALRTAGSYVWLYADLFSWADPEAPLLPGSESPQATLRQALADVAADPLGPVR